jgi:hypothetical protein
MSKLTVIEAENVNSYRALALHKALKLECKGLGRRGPSASSLIKAETGLKGSGKTLLERYETLLKSKGILIEKGG